MPAHIVMQRRRIDAGVYAAGRQQRRQARCEANPAFGVGQVQWLYAEAVARKHDPSAVPFPDCEGEHPAKSLDAPAAPGRIGLEDHLGVAIREEPVALRDQLCAKLAEIIDAAVEDDCEAERWIGHRLLRFGLKIEDAEAAMPEGDILLQQDP